jgi:hypothetical protein
MTSRRRSPAVYICFDAVRPMKEWSPLDHVNLYLILRKKYPNELPDTQIVIDRMLAELLDGTSPSVVFARKPRRGKQGKRDDIVGQAACAEVMRLSTSKILTETDKRRVEMKLLPSFFLRAWPNLTESDAIKLVAQSFSKSPRQIKRYVTSFSRKLECGGIDTYVHNLGALIARSNGVSPNDYEIETMSSGASTAYLIKKKLATNRLTK